MVENAETDDPEWQLGRSVRTEAGERSPLRVATDRLDIILLFVAWGYFLAFAVRPDWFGALPHRKDPMALSGFLTVLLAVLMADFVQRSFWPRLDRLYRRSQLVISDGDFQGFRVGPESYSV
jgi:hypothetical protein